MPIAQVFPVSGALSLATYAIQRALHPLYGSVPTRRHLLKVIAGSTAVAGLSPGLSLDNALYLAPFALAAAPQIVYRVGCYTTDWKDAEQGAPATLAAALIPIFYSGISVAKHVSAPDLANGIAILELIIAIAVNVPIVDALVNSIWPMIPNIWMVDDVHILCGIGLAATLAWVSKAGFVDTITMKQDKKSSKPPKTTTRINIINIVKFAVALTTLGASAAFRPTLYPVTTPFHHPTKPVRILSSVRSVTGVVTVGETIPINYSLGNKTLDDAHALLSDARYLRVDHSLIGGVWIGSKQVTIDGTGAVAVDENGTKLGDSIYSTFVLQEATRLVARTNPKTALTIGLGAGISTQAFQQHGLQTTIVEIDPAVYAAARQYFGLSDPTANGGSVHLQDARSFVANRSALNAEIAQPVLYDIVVHDCFSGGGVPGHIFTTEFWEKLKSIMNPKGVIAVNFAGAPNSPSARSILATLNKTFGSCRAFHDYTADISPEKLETEFINMVFFCRPSGIAVSFRPPVEADYLNSYLRRHMFADFQSREVPPEVLAKVEYTGLRPQNPDADEWVLTDLHNPLEAWQNDGAMHHWQVMQDVLPALYWKTY